MGPEEFIQKITNGNSTAETKNDDNAAIIVEKITEEFKNGMGANEIMTKLKQDNEVLNYMFSPVEKVVVELESIVKKEKAKLTVARSNDDNADYAEIVKEIFDGYKEELEAFISGNYFRYYNNYGVIRYLSDIPNSDVMNILAMSLRKATKNNIMLLAYNYSNYSCDYDNIVCIFTSKELLGFENEELTFAISYDEISNAAFSKSDHTITIDTINQEQAQIAFTLDNEDDVSSVAFLYNILMDIVDAVNG